MNVRREKGGLRASNIDRTSSYDYVKSSVFDRSGVVAIRRKEEGNRNENNDSSDIEFHGRSKANKIVYVRAT